MGKRIRKKLGELQKYPERGNYLRYSAFWTLGVGGYRIIYEIDKKEQKVIVFLSDIEKMYTIIFQDYSKRTV